MILPNPSKSLVEGTTKKVRDDDEFAISSHREMDGWKMLEDYFFREGRDSG